MAEPFIGQILLVGFNFAPQGWALCNGQLLSISQNAALFSLLGTFYGGDGISTFGLPDLRGRAPVHQGQGPGLSNYVIGEVTGAESVTLLSNQMPQHNHFVNAVNSPGNAGSPSGALLAETATRGAVSGDTYSSSPTNTTLAPNAVSLTGGSQPHNNIQPVLVMNYIIALTGIFPSRG